MSTTRQHLIETHTREGEHLVKRAKFHKAMAGHFGKLAELQKAAKSEMHGEEDAAETYQGISDAHSGMADECLDKATYHTDCAKSLAAAHKAMGLDDGDRIIPDDVRGIITKFSPDVRMVPRVGAPTAPEAPDVPQEFQDLVKIE